MRGEQHARIANEFAVVGLFGKTVEPCARDGAVILHSENPAYEPMVFTDGVELIGKVVTVMRGIR